MTTTAVAAAEASSQAHRAEATRRTTLQILQPYLSSKNQQKTIVFAETSVVSATECRLALEKLQNQKIGEWIKLGVPTVEDAIPLNGYLYVLLGYLPRLDGTQLSAEWNCGTRSAANPNLTTSVYKTRRLNWEKGKTMIRCPDHWNVTHIWPSIPSNTSGTCPMYDIRPYKTCNDWETKEFQDKVSFKGNIQFGACQIVRGRKSRQNLHEWIAYHHLLGFQHILIYLNQPWNLEGLPQLDYVTYIPYNFYLGHQVNHANPLVIHWQVPMQMRCLWNAKKFGLDWIGSLQPIRTSLSTFKIPTSLSPMRLLCLWHLHHFCAMRTRQ
ncbi:hypothetical protein ACA910_021318 [Epithemia clementina (nom. ined.)]